MTFEEWLTELNAIAKVRGYCGDPLLQQTGEECWRNFFDDGYSPRDALDEDESNG